jgi:hypothetical protein
MSHAAFATDMDSSASRVQIFGATSRSLHYGLITRRHPYDGVVGRLQNPGFPTDPATLATGLRLLPRWD